MKAKMICMALALALVFSLTAVIMPAGTVRATDLCVNPSGTGGCYNSIQDAIDAANAAGGDTIIIAPGTYDEHDITINKSLTIQGAGAGVTSINGQDISRVFHINGSYTVSMSDMTIRNGNATGDVGGGIYNNGGNLTLTDCTISDNYAGYGGGGICSEGGTLTMTDCTIIDNNKAVNAGNYGGGIYIDHGDVTLTNCTISGNTAGSWGGGICCYNYSSMTMTNCTVSDNYSGEDGGGIYIDHGSVTITNCTVSGNTAGDGGGGIYTEADLDPDTVTLNYCTITDNTAEGSGGGICNLDDSVELKCTIVYGNIADPAPNINSTYTDIGCNIVDSPDPLLGLLGDNGGPTFTHALLAGSPAIDTCDCDCSVNTDQRGQPRPVDGDLDGTAVCDVGAYEKQVTVGGIVEPVDLLEQSATYGEPSDGASASTFIALGIGIAVLLAALIVWSVRRRRVA